jgi:hypothetical protein
VCPTERDSSRDLCLEPFGQLVQLARVEGHTNSAFLHLRGRTKNQVKYSTVQYSTVQYSTGSGLISQFRRAKHLPRKSLRG